MTGPAGNQLLDRLPAEDRAAVLDLGQRRDMVVHEVFCLPNQPIAEVQFVIEGVISAVGEMHDGRSIEVFMVGPEGAAGAEAGLIPARAGSRQVCQVAGTRLGVDAARLRELTAVRPALRDALLHSQVGMQHELERSTACHALHRAEQRLAKWLLRCHDRVLGDVLPLTQEYLASMLGSQRTTVNEAAQALLDHGAVRYARGRVTILDRAVLEAAACECYRAPSGSDLPDSRT